MQKKSNLIILLCCAVYFVSYLTRTNYGAIMVEMIQAEGISKTEASFALTVSAVTYAVGQLVSGYLGDKIKPEKLILLGLSGATLMNILISILPVWMRPVLWGINGFSQAMIWPPLVRILSGVFDGDTYKKATLDVSLAANIATIFVYLISPFIIKLTSWHFVFIISAIFGMVVIVLFSVFSKKIDYRRAEVVKKSEGTSTAVKGAVLVLGIVAFAIILQGILRDGLTNWTPTLVSETFKLDSETSILSGVILPIFSMLSLSVSSFVSRKLIKNEFLCAGAFFFLGALGLFIMAASSNMVISLLGAALAQGVMHGVNYCFTCLVPPYFYKLNKTSLVAGLINCGAYIGSSISGIGTAILMNYMDWNGVIKVWCGVAVLGVLVCTLTGLLWKNFKNNNRIEEA